MEEMMFASWFPRLCFCGHCRNLEFTIQYDVWNVCVYVFGEDETQVQW